MSVDADRAWVVVLGATGFMGRLVCRALRRRGVRFAIAGRSAHKLARLSESLGGVEQRVVDARSKDALRAVLNRRLLVASCVGPFVEVGEPALAIAAEQGVHYVDVSREQPFAVRAFQHHDTAARAGQACIVPALALEPAVADWGATLLAERLGGALDALDVVYVTNAPSRGLHASRGELRSALATLGRGDARRYVGGSLARERDGSVVRRFGTHGRGEVTASSFGGAEAIAVPQHLNVGELRTYRARPPFAARALQAMRHIAPQIARASRGPLERALPYVAEGPDLDARSAIAFEIVLDARRGSARARVHVTGNDPYAVTAEIQAHAAEAALAGNVEASGVVAPSVGYPALAAFASLAHVLDVEIEGDELATVPMLRSIRPASVHKRSRAPSRYSWHTIAS